MIRLGVCSGACITRDIHGVLAAASAARLDAVEWAADAHIGAGDLKTASDAMMATLRAGLTTASYATLYRAGAEDEGYRKFEAFLDVASALQAPIMRVYLREKRGWEELGEVLVRLGDRAASRGIRLCLSLGRGTGLDRYDRIPALIGAVAHEFVRLAWEDLPGSGPAAATAALARAGSFAGLVLARCAGRDGRPRAVAKDEAAWRERLASFKLAEMDPKMGSFVLLGAARAEGPAGGESLAADAATLRAIAAGLG